MVFHFLKLCVKEAVFAVVAGIVAPIIARALPEAICNAKMLLGFLLGHCEKTAGFRGNLAKSSFSNGKNFDFN